MIVVCAKCIESIGVSLHPRLLTLPRDLATPKVSFAALDVGHHTETSTVAAVQTQGTARYHCSISNLRDRSFHTHRDGVSRAHRGGVSRAPRDVQVFFRTHPVQPTGLIEASGQCMRRCSPIPQRPNALSRPLGQYPNIASLSVNSHQRPVAIPSCKRRPQHSKDPVHRGRSEPNTRVLPRCWQGERSFDNPADRLLRLRVVER